MLGPIELVVISFPGSKFEGEIIPALRDVIDRGIIKIVDMIFAIKDKDGNVEIAELADLDDETAMLFAPLMSNVSRGFLTEADAGRIAQSLNNDSSGCILLIENVWAKELGQAVARANGEILLNEYVRRDVIEQLVNS